MILHGYFRSTAAWRVRIALAIKGIDARLVSHDLRIGEQRAPDYLPLNPQGFVPALEIDGAVLTQSLAIIDYLDETHPEPPLLPADAIGRARVRAMAQVIACDIHPLNNLRVLETMRRDFGCDEAGVRAWCARWIGSGFAALEAMVAPAGGHCFGDRVTLADLCLVPQMFNARRFGTDLAAYPRLVAIDAHLARLPAFADTAPDRQADAN